MQRKSRRDEVERFSPIKEYPELKVILRKAARWTSDNIKALREGNTEGLIDANDRDLDNWLPLFSIADLVGGDWPKLAREAAVKLTGSRRKNQKSSSYSKTSRSFFAANLKIPPIKVATLYPAPT
jgi:hypothetical protein